MVRSEGEDALAQEQLTAAEFTEFLVWSKHKNTPFHHDILYNPKGEFWLIVTFPLLYALILPLSSTVRRPPVICGLPG